MMELLYIHSNDHLYIMHTLFDKIGEFLERNEATEEVQNLLKVFLFDDIPELTDFIKTNGKWTIKLDKIDLCYFISLPIVEDILYAAVTVTTVRKNGYYWFG